MVGKEFRGEKKRIKRSLYGKVLGRNGYLGEMLYCKRGVMGNERLLN